MQLDIHFEMPTYAEQIQINQIKTLFWAKPQKIELLASQYLPKSSAAVLNLKLNSSDIFFFVLIFFLDCEIILHFTFFKVKNCLRLLMDLQIGNGIQFQFEAAGLLWPKNFGIWIAGNLILGMPPPHPTHIKQPPHPALPPGLLASNLCEASL